MDGGGERGGGGGVIGLAGGRSRERTDENAARYVETASHGHTATGVNRFPSTTTRMAACQELYVCSVTVNSIVLAPLDLMK